MKKYGTGIKFEIVSHTFMPRYFWWRAKGRNNKIICHSENMVSAANCRKSIRSFLTFVNLGDYQIVEVKEER